MKVQIAIPIDLRLHNTGEFLLSKQTSDGTWEVVETTTAVSGGEYLADLAQGHYQKTLAASNGLSTFSSLFEITPDGTYIDEAGKTFKIGEDGTLTDEIAQ